MGDKIKAFIDKLNSDIKDLWAKDKVFLIIFGVLILIVKFRGIIIDLLLNNVKSIENSSAKQDAKLKAEEVKDSDAADSLVQKSADEGKEEIKVDKDWYKTEK